MVKKTKFWMTCRIKENIEDRKLIGNRVMSKVP